MKMRKIETTRTEPVPVPYLAYSVDEAAQASGLSRSKLYSCMGEGSLKFIKCRARRLILVADLEAFLNRLPRTCIGNGTFVYRRHDG